MTRSHRSFVHPTPAVRRFSRHLLFIGSALACWFVTSPAVLAQTERPLVFSARVSDRERAVLGIQLGASARSDTAGVRIDVDADGPASKAGLKAGDVISEINGVSLRISAADAEDMSLQGLGQRRLQRAMSKVKPGDEVSLRVRSGAVVRTVSVKTVSAADLERTAARAVAAPGGRVDPVDQRGAVGVSVNATGSIRDTLGLFIASVVGGGPAEKAGIIEGERISAINGIDVRIPHEDLEDSRAVSARVSRFVREVQKTAPGEGVTLRVMSGGRSREVKVAAVKMSDLPSQGFQMRLGDDGVQFFRGGEGSSMDFMPFELLSPSPSGGRARVRGSLNGQPFDFDSGPLEQSMQRLRDRMQQLGRDMRIELRSTTPGNGGAVMRLPSAPKRATTAL